MEPMLGQAGQTATTRIRAAATRAATPPPPKSEGRTTVPEQSPPRRDAAAQSKGLEGAARLAGLNKDVLRKAFVRKVYGIVAAQMLVTASVALACVRIELVRRAMLSMALQGWWRLVILIPTFACLFGLRWMSKAFPWNYCLLLGFTLCIATNVGFACVTLAEAGLVHLLVQAAGLTGAIFLVLSVFTLRSERDFTFLRGFLPVALWALSIGSLGGWLFGVRYLDGLIAWCGALVFCGYIVFDTNMLANKLDYDEYIRGAAELYLDIINLFLRILKILIKLQGGKKKKN